MGAGASTVSHDDAKKFPQYQLLGGDAKWVELKDDDGKLSLDKIHDPYLACGGRYAESKQEDDFVYVEYDTIPHFSLDHTSVLSKVLTGDMFNRYKSIRTSKGFTFSNAIQAGVVSSHLTVGVAAGDEECFKLFPDLYYGVIKNVTGFDAKEQVQVKDLDASKLKFSSELHGKFKHFVKSVRARAVRNFGNFSFPPGTDDADRQGVEDILRGAFTTFSDDLAGAYHSLDSLDGNEIAQQLHDRGHLFQKPSANSLETSSGAARHWPRNRGIFASTNLDTVVWVNDRDHAFIIASDDTHADVLNTFARLARTSNALESHAKSHGSQFAWEDHFGHLASDPSNLGTGLKVSLTLQLPQFSTHRDLLKTIAHGFDLTVADAPHGNIVISNGRRIGLSEVQLVQSVIDGVSRIIHYEEQLVAHSKEQVEEEFYRDLNVLSIKTIFVGPPGSGKGTQAPRIKNEYSLAHLSTGDMLRDAVAKGTELGQQAKSVMESGKLVSDELVAQIVSEAIQGEQCRHGFILDGFPRTANQAVLLDGLLGTAHLPVHPPAGIDCVINLVVADELLIKRITGRLIHPASGRSYNIYFNPPVKEGFDDITGESLIKRGDDTEDKLRTRLEEFHEKTQPVLTHYAAKVVDIPADGDMEVISSHIRNALNRIQNEKKSQVFAHYSQASIPLHQPAEHPHGIHRRQSSLRGSNQHTPRSARKETPRSSSFRKDDHPEPPRSARKEENHEAPHSARKSEHHYDPPRSARKDDH
jgi:adenylate kinase